MAFTIKQGDTKPAYVMALKDEAGKPGETPINLEEEGVKEVFFIMRKQGSTGTPKVKAKCVIDDKAAGIVSYHWVAGDTDTPDKYDVEFEMVFTDGGIETVPNGDYFEVIVKDDLDSP